MLQLIRIISAILAMALAGLTGSAQAAHQRILFIGDSHSVGTFGHKLDELLRTIPDAEIHTIASCGSSPQWWIEGTVTPCGYFERDPNGAVKSSLKAPTPILKDVLASFRPTLILVEQGANLMSAPLDWSSQTTHRLVTEIQAGGSACLWIGPPHSRLKPEPGASELNGLLRGATAEVCRYLDSRPFAHYPDKGGDGIHYDSLGPSGSKMMENWASEVKKAVAEMN